MFFSYLFIRYVWVTEKSTDEEIMPIVHSGETISQWEARKQDILKTFETQVYGSVPKTTFEWEVDKRTLDEGAFQGAQVELISMRAPESSIVLHVVLVMPPTSHPVPVIVSSHFCPNHLRFPEYDIPKPIYFPLICSIEKIIRDSARFVFGSSVESFPFGKLINPSQKLVAHDIAFASIYLAEGIPDTPHLAKEALSALSQYSENPAEGALAAWAWQYGEIVKELEKDQRIDSDKIIIYGHSRDGKAALLAGASYGEVDGVIAHQSGKGGSALWQSDTGERIINLTSKYPHWFPERLSAYQDKESELLIDQHMMLALIAPRPLLISGAVFDKWADPISAFNAARSASSVYELYGARGIENTSLYNFNQDSQLAFFMRPWFHGVRMSDWDVFISFINAHFKD